MADISLAEVEPQVSFCGYIIYPSLEQNGEYLYLWVSDIFLVETGASPYFEGPILRKVARVRCVEGLLLRESLYFVKVSYKKVRRKGLFQG